MFCSVNFIMAIKKEEVCFALIIRKKREIEEKIIKRQWCGSIFLVPNKRNADPDTVTQKLST